LRDFGDLGNLRVGAAILGRQHQPTEVAKMTVTLHLSVAELTALIVKEKRTRRRRNCG